MKGCAKLPVLALLLGALLVVALSHASVAAVRVVPAPARVVRPPVAALRHLVFMPAAPFQSAWAVTPPSLDGVASAAEWEDAARMGLEHGSLRLQNDLKYLYVLLDVTADTTNDISLPSQPWGDYFWLVWDVNGDRNVTPDVDLLHGTYPGTDTLGLSRFVEPGAVTPLSPSQALLARGFGATPDSAAPHRFWEIAIPLVEVGADAAGWADNPLDAHPLRLGLHVHSETPLISDYIPQNVLQDFSRFIRILLALSPDVTRLGGPIFATVGVIPSTEIQGGYATTDPSYTLYVHDAPFGSTLNLFGHFDGLRARGAKYYQVLARPVGTPDWAPLRLTWSNYRWEGDRFVLRQTAPDPQDRYELPLPSEIWSLRDLLVRWPTGSLPDGLWELKVALFDAAKSPLPEPGESEGNRLALMLDNTPPHVAINQVTQGEMVVGRCVIVDLGPPPDGLRFRITAVDYQGHLSDYRLVANYGDNESQLISADTYASHVSPTRRWYGVASHLLPPAPGQWRPPEPCAYQFHLVAHNRTTNGYSRRIHWRTYSKHTTVLMGGPPPIAPPGPPKPPESAPPGLSVELPAPRTPGPGPTFRPSVSPMF